MFKLLVATPAQKYLEKVMQNFNAFLQDHAANERKVGQASIQIIARHPMKKELCLTLQEIAIEEFTHFKEVTQLLHQRGKSLGRDKPDYYMKGMREMIRTGDFNLNLMDQLICFAVVEARGCERFAIIHDGLGEEESQVKAFYFELLKSEARHHGAYLRMARLYFDHETVEQRLNEILQHEKKLIETLPISGLLH